MKLIELEPGQLETVQDVRDYTDKLFKCEDVTGDEKAAFMAGYTAACAVTGVLTRDAVERGSQETFPSSNEAFQAGAKAVGFGSANEMLIRLAVWMTQL